MLLSVDEVVRLVGLGVIGYFLVSGLVKASEVAFRFAAVAALVYALFWWKPVSEWTELELPARLWAAFWPWAQQAVTSAAGRFDTLLKLLIR